jgi:hypothetical protein
MLVGRLGSRTSFLQSWRGGSLIIGPFRHLGCRETSCWPLISSGDHNVDPGNHRLSWRGASTSKHPTALASQVAWITGESQISRPCQISRQVCFRIFFASFLFFSHLFFQAKKGHPRTVPQKKRVEKAYYGDALDLKYESLTRSKMFWSSVLKLRFLKWLFDRSKNALTCGPVPQVNSIPGVGIILFIETRCAHKYFNFKKDNNLLYTVKK